MAGVAGSSPAAPTTAHWVRTGDIGNIDDPPPVAGRRSGRTSDNFLSGDALDRQQPTRITQGASIPILGHFLERHFNLDYPQWPFDWSTITRFGLYLLITVGSMIGGALVERVVDIVLD